MLDQTLCHANGYSTIGNHHIVLINMTVCVVVLWDWLNDEITWLYECKKFVSIHTLPYLAYYIINYLANNTLFIVNWRQLCLRICMASWIMSHFVAIFRTLGDIMNIISFWSIMSSLSYHISLLFSIPHILVGFDNNNY